MLEHVGTSHTGSCSRKLGFVDEQFFSFSYFIDHAFQFVNSI